MKQTTQPTAIELAEQRFGKDELDRLSKEFGGRKLNIIAVEDKVAVLQPINAKVLSDYTRTVVNGELDVASRQLLNDLWIGGDECIRDDEEYFMSAMIEIQNVIELKKSTFGKY